MTNGPQDIVIVPHAPLLLMIIQTIPIGYGIGPSVSWFVRLGPHPAKWPMALRANQPLQATLGYRMISLCIKIVGRNRKE